MADKFQWPEVRITIKPLEERHVVTLAIFLLAAGMLLMARENPDLWEVDLFTIILQAVVISGIIGSILAFHFAANKSDEKKSDNAAKAFDAIAAATASASPDDAAKTAARDVADAASDKADGIAGGAGTGELPASERLNP
jgi:hypothetical protein